MLNVTQNQRRELKRAWAGTSGLESGVNRSKITGYGSVEDDRNLYQKFTDRWTWWKDFYIICVDTANIFAFKDPADAIPVLK